LSWLRQVWLCWAGLNAVTNFSDAEKVFANPMLLFEDTRDDYGEQRMIGIGLMDFLVVLIVHVEAFEEIRIISMRKADSDETDLSY
jgi:hypothetical protein